MNHSFVKISSACPKTNVADVDFNVKNIKLCIDKALNENSKVVVFPELSITSYTCADLFSQSTLLNNSLNGIKDLCDFLKDKDIVVVVGAPLLYNYCLYNCAYVLFKGSIIGIVPKSYIPNYVEFYEKRWFTEGLNVKNEFAEFPFQADVPFGSDLIFRCGDLKLGLEICEDLWAPIPPSSYLSIMGANVILNPSASNEVVSKADYRRSLISNQSGRCMCAYIYSSAGVFESSTDVVFSGHMLICENGSILSENDRFERDNLVLTSIIDLEKLQSERLKNVTFRDSIKLCTFKPNYIDFTFSNWNMGNFDRFIDSHPFVPSNEKQREARCKEIFNIQTAGLAKRFTHTGLKKAVIGISGGLDSTLALVVIVKTFDMLGISRKNIITVTMPGFGTTDKTYNNAVDLCNYLGCDLREIDIVPACLLHFKDINHPKETHDVTYENVQARERTQILMDIANKEGGLLIGTGDLSELALGWCTYNGDHMSMYAVNSSIPKTLVRYLVLYVAEKELTGEVSKTLIDILNTPVSPELLPKDAKGNISQKTEDIIGPYELHDFFLYYFMKQGSQSEKIIFMAQHAFKNVYSKETIEKWFKLFIKRFFSQQFKRSAIPDGPKVGTISLSPRGDLRMPSDASYNGWNR
ncbi:NAD(+) synthase [Clostridium felsineum]|uniref:Glutamine-dependent NAD(+) synthetase n=1 Tax=Clostridium felsineum TaxID=36839 RepID=A0A1S8LD71_9CLOT|nr:NAD(+) synthase [Clostridium felsineum]URZ05861.1 Glutamine-dependent NAD(+) synthetase [Clostridium felsineum]URZ10898.1 Glutamine-dependent NAD(+) synthetase [Clostridium felsineum]